MPGSIWFRVAELLGSTIAEARQRMTPAELSWWADHWERFPIYDDSLLARPQEPEQMNAAIKAFFERLDHGQH